MTDYTAVNREIEHGQRVELGELKRARVRWDGGLRLQGVEAGDPTEYVVLSTDLDDGEDVDIHPKAKVLGIVERKRNTASLVYLMLTEVYAE